MICPYPNCGGEIQKQGAAGHCPRCSQPAFFCPQCDSANRAFARHCRSCNGNGSELRFPTTTATASWEEDFPSDFPNKSKHVEITEAFWTCPLVYRGFIWCLSMSGAVWKVLPYGRPQAISFGLLG